jgi:hypothetical protein
MPMPNVIRGAALAFAGLVLAASIHAAADDSKRAATARPEQGRAAAAAEKARPAAAPEVVPSERSAGPAPAQRPRYKGRTIRCWQFGRLIVEEPVVGGLTPESQVFQVRQPGDGPGLQLLELKDAVCIVGPAAR